MAGKKLVDPRTEIRNPLLEGEREDDPEQTLEPQKPESSGEGGGRNDVETLPSERVEQKPDVGRRPSEKGRTRSDRS